MESYKLSSDPPMELFSASDVSEYFRNGGRLSFRIPRGSKILYVKHLKRLNRLEAKRRAQKGKLSRLIFQIYYVYRAIVEFFICWNRDSLRDSFWIYYSYICDIESFNGENLNEDEILVTYNGRAIDPKNKVKVIRSPGFDWSKD